MAARRKTGLQHLRKRVIGVVGRARPGLVTGAADDDPSGIATYSQAGAQFGYGLMWTMLLCYPLMSAVQLVSAHIGRVTGAGLASNLSRAFPRKFVGLLIGILLIANIINIGADLSAMAAAAQLVAGGSEHAFVIGMALAGVLLQLLLPYRRYANILKWLTLSLFAYVAVLLVVRVDWLAALRGLVWPSGLGHDAIITIVALFGTTISPYLFFWQSSQEAEEMATSRQRPIRQEPRSAARQFRRMRFDTLSGMAFSNLISLAIIMAAAATLNRQGISQIGSAATRRRRFARSRANSPSHCSQSGSSARASSPFPCSPVRRLSRWPRSSAGRRASNTSRSRPRASIRSSSFRPSSAS